MSDLEDLVSQWKAARPIAWWGDEIIWAHKLDRAALAAMLIHTGACSQDSSSTGWPDHIVYSNRQAYGSILASLWMKYEANIRDFVGAGPAGSYEAPKDDPADRAYHTTSVIERLQACNGAR